MDESRIHERIAQQRHDIPEGFHARMDARVQQVIAHKPARRRVHRLQLAAALCLLISAGALALQRSGLLDFRVSYMRESYYFTLPAAQELVHRLDIQVPFEGGTLTMKEALYDGRWLQVLYSVTDHSATRPFTQQEKENIQNGDLQGFYALLDAADAYPSAEANGTLVVDGVPVNIYSLSATGGEEPGEYLFLCDSLLEKTESPGDAPAFLRPAGVMALSLPMINRQGVQVAQAQAMLEVGNVTARYALPLPAPVQLEDAQLAFADVFASPASVVLAYTITSLAPPQPDAEGADDAPDWPSIRPVDAQGQPAGTLRESYSMLTLLPDGRAQRRYQLTYTPAAQAQPLRLQLPDGQVLDVSPTKAN